MQSKLTLTIDDQVIGLAKAYAQEQGRSLSQIIEHHLRALTRNIEPRPINAKVKQMRGSMREPKDFDYTQDLTKALADKHLGR